MSATARRVAREPRTARRGAPRPVLTAVLLALVALVATAAGAVVYQPSLDEAFVYALTQHGLVGVLDAWAEDPQALLPQLVAYPFGIVGDAMWWMRLPSVLAFTGAVVATWWAVRHRLGEQVAALGALLVAVSPLGLLTATDARWPAIALLLATISWGALLRAVDPGSGRRWWVAYAAALLLGVHANLLVLLMVPAQLVVILLAGRRTWIPWVASLAVVGAGTVPLLAALRASDAPNPLVRVGRPTVTEIPGFAAVILGTGSPERIRQLAVVVAVVIVAAGLWTLRGRMRSDAGREAALLLSWAVVPIACAFVVSQGANSIWLTRYVVGCLPGIMLLVAWSALRLPRRAAGAAALVALLGLTAMTVHTVASPQEERTEDWVQALARARAPGTPALFYEAEGVQVAGYFDEQFADADGDPIVPGWDRTPVPAGIVLLDNPTFDRLPPGPPDAALVRRLLRVNGSLVMAVRPADPEPAGVVWARANCDVTRNDFPPMAVFAVTGCRAG